jgi:hypothetical protein
MAGITVRNLISILGGTYWSYSRPTTSENIMSTLSVHPAAAVQFSAMATSVARFVREMFGAVRAGANDTEVWALYRQTRGSDAVSPAVIDRLALHAQAH